MAYRIPSSQDTQSLLRKFCHAELHEIGKQSGVPFPTIMKIRQGVTRNPGVETVRRILAAPVVLRALGPSTEKEPTNA